jgi:CRP-like cAMP-binding protein
MNDETFNLALDYLNKITIRKNEHFIKEGIICNNIAFINKGLLRIYYLKEGTEINTCFCRENSITSSFDSFINRTPSKEYIQALENVELITLSYENLLKLYELSPDWQRVSRLMTERECLRLSDRLTSLSFKTAKEKYLNLLETQPEIIQRVSIQHIASYLGISALLSFLNYKKNPRKSDFRGAIAGSALIFLGLYAMFYGINTGLIFILTTDELIEMTIKVYCLSVGTFFLFHSWQLINR